MRPATFVRWLPLFLAIGCVSLLAQWSFSNKISVAARVPGLDGRPKVSEMALIPLDLHGKLVKNDQNSTLLDQKSANWPGFRGKNRDNLAVLDGFSPNFEPKNIKKRWEVALGEGYAAPAIANGRVYLLDYDPVEHSDALRCWSLETGEILWTRSYPNDLKRDHGMSRTIPALSEKFVVTLGPRCHVSCADARTGEFRWGLDLVAQFKTKVPQWYAGQCPLIDGERVILAPAGDETLMMAVDLGSGEIAWKTPNPRKWAMTHSSIMPMTFEGTRMYVYCGSGGVAGVSADDGKLLWDTTAWKVSMATVPAPVPIPPDKIFLSGGYGAGAMLLQLKKSGGTITAEMVYQLPEKIFGAVQQTPVYFKNHLYGVIPGGQLVCLDVESGKQLWNSGNEKFGYGPFLICNDRVFALSDSGTLTVAEATPEAYRPVGQFAAIPEGHECWGPMAMADGRLLVRDLRRLVCLDLREGKHE